MSLRGTYTATSSPPSPTTSSASSSTSSSASSPTSSDYSLLSVTDPPSPSRISHQKHRQQFASFRGGKKGAPGVWSALHVASHAWKTSSGNPDASSANVPSRLLRMIGARPLRPRRSKFMRLLLFLMAITFLHWIILRIASHSREQQERPFTQVQSETRAAVSTSRVPLPGAVLLGHSGNHTVERGLLHVDMNNRVHPIYQLIGDAREAWDNKMDRQSRSLREAVKEYQRRYGRPPPKGFDRWWNYVVVNKVTLPDEYDQIDRDLLPFRSLSWRDLNRRVDRVSRLPDTYTLQVKNGRLHASVSFDINIDGGRERVDGQAALIEPIAGELEDFTAVYWVHDTPRGLISHGHRFELSEYLDEDEYFGENEELDLSLRGWPAMCPASSRLGNESGLAPVEFAVANGTRTSYSFIADHYQTMDLCDHAELVHLHGLLLGKNPQAAPLTPLFVLSKTTLHADILGVPVEQIIRGMGEVPWEEKVEDRLLWRGSNTGTHYSRETMWRDTHRTRLLKLVNEDRGEVELLSPPKAMDGKSVGEGRRKLPINALNEYYFDMAFTGRPSQCNATDGTCQELADEYRFTGLMTHDAALQYKYVIDVDGNAWSARFQRLLSAGSLIFKTTIFPEWWTDRIQPWVHYVPIQVDYSDLYDVIAFFRGDISGRGGEPALAKEIAAAGKQWADANWRQEDLTSYVFRLYLEWARLLGPRRSEMDFVYDERMERRKMV